MKKKFKKRESWKSGKFESDLKSNESQMRERESGRGGSAELAPPPPHVLAIN